LFGNKVRLRRFLLPFWPLMRPYVPRYALAIVLQASVTLLTLAPPFIVKIAIDKAIGSSNTRQLGLLSLLAVGVVVLGAALNSLLEYTHEWVSAWFTSDLRRSIFAKVQRQSLNFFSSSRVGEILGRLHDDVVGVYAVVVNICLDALNEVIQIVGILAILCYLNIWLAMVDIIFIPLVVLVLLVSSQKLQPLSHAVREKDVSLLEFLEERITNIQAVKIFGREAREDQHHADVSRALISATLRRVKLKFLAMCLISSFSGSAAILVVWLGGYDAIRGALTIGSLFAFYLYTVRLYTPVETLAKRIVDISASFASAQRTLEYMDLPVQVQAGTGVKLKEAQGRISCQKVYFAYQQKGAAVLQDVNLTIHCGEIVAIMGPSGSGKTTLVNLLCRLLSPGSGSVLLDDVNLEDLSNASLRQHIGMVPQDAYILNASIRENISLGRSDASDAEILAAAQVASLDAFIQDLPEGYRTVVGSRGMNLSGGQRQRIALARVILLNPSVLILDEATAALDADTEKEVLNSLTKFGRSKTVIFVTHRPSVAAIADRVYSIERGRLTEIYNFEPSALHLRTKELSTSFNDRPDIETASREFRGNGGSASAGSHCE
jgi:ABC-type bacteriocin/lantibiotic exporter with double-glycine peptidase domain